MTNLIIVLDDWQVVLVVWCFGMPVALAIKEAGVGWLKRIAYLFDCMHPHTTWPRREPSGWDYVCGLDCGRELPYSLERMCIIKSAEGGRSQKHSSVTNSALTAPLILLMCLVLLLGRAAAQTAGPAAMDKVLPPHATNDGASTLVIGFVGGFVDHNDVRHSEVQLARHLQENYGDRIKVEMFENRQKAQAHKAILEWVNKNEVQRQARIILFGHSWGASTVVYLARQLQRDRVPITLTVQVDSIRKHGEDDSIIPANVLEAINFYQTKGFVHGRAAIAAADPSRTTILGNLRFDYLREPAECRVYPWYDRLLFKGHTSIECDPHVWSQVESYIAARLPNISQTAKSQVTAALGN